MLHQSLHEQHLRRTVGRLCWRNTPQPDCKARNAGRWTAAACRLRLLAVAVDAVWRLVVLVWKPVGVVFTVEEVIGPSTLMALDCGLAALRCCRTGRTSAGRVDCRAGVIEGLCPPPEGTALRLLIAEKGQCPTSDHGNNDTELTPIASQVLF